MMKVLHEEIERIHQIMNLHEGEHSNLLYLKRRFPVDDSSELFSDAISKASNMLRKKKDKIGGTYDLKKFMNTVVGVMYDSFFHDFLVRGETISADLSSDEVWDYIVHVFGDRIADRYYEIMNSPSE